MAESERVWSAAFDKASEGEAFAAQLGAVLRSYLDTTTVTRDAMTRAMAADNIASRTDLALLGERLDRLTDAVDTLSEEVRALRLREHGPGAADETSADA